MGSYEKISIQQKKRKAFISHINSVARDRNLAVKLAKSLRSVGLKVFLDVDSLQGGRSIVEVIDQHIEECDYFVPILSPEALQSRWVRHEIDAAIQLRNDHKRNGRPLIVPVLAADCGVTPLLRPFPYFRFYGRNYKFPKALTDFLARGLRLKRLPAKVLVKTDGIRRKAPQQRWLTAVKLYSVPPFHNTSGKDLRRWLVKVAPRYRSYPFGSSRGKKKKPGAWTDQELKEVLTLRLQAFLRIESLAEITIFDFADTIEHELLKASKGSPKRMSRLVDLLFRETARRWLKGDPKKTEKMITRADWKVALRQVAG